VSWEIFFTTLDLLDAIIRDLRFLFLFPFSLEF